MAGSGNVEEVVKAVVPRLQDAVTAEVRRLAQELAARAEQARARAAAEHEAALDRERRKAVAERAAAISSAVDEARARAEAAAAERLLDAVRRLDAQTTLGGVLDALTDLAGAAAGRAALFVVADDGGLRTWRRVGFHGPAGGEKPVLAIADAGVVARALDEGRSVRVARSGGAPQDGPPAFAALPADAAGVAVPVPVGGEPLVAVYADGGTGGSGSDGADWMPAVELLARHAGARLEALTAARAAAFAHDAVSSKAPHAPEAAPAGS